MNKLWAGRTSGVTDSVADDFNSSIRFDCRLYREDIAGSMAHAAMLGEKGIITDAEADALIDGLQGILNDLDDGTLAFDWKAEDIHMFVEQVLTERLGEVGKKLHTARSRNDQVALDLRLHLRHESDAIAEQVKDLIATIVRVAEQNKTAIICTQQNVQRLFSGKLRNCVVREAAPVSRVFHDSYGHFWILSHWRLCTNKASNNCENR